MRQVLSLGGSIVSLLDGLNLDFLKKFKRLIEDRVKHGDHFIIVVGGGSLAREYVKFANYLKRDIKKENQDYLGIYSTWLNAFLLKSIFGDLAYDKLVDDPSRKVKTNRPLIFSGGYQPGNSSDFVAVLLAETYKIKTIVNLSNIDYVYDQDPRKFKTARKIKNIDWSNFLKIIGTDWKPGMNAPFDPVASLRCQKKDKKVIVLNGSNINNLKKYFSGENYRGTEIKN